MVSSFDGFVDIDFNIYLFLETSSDETDDAIDPQ